MLPKINRIKKKNDFGIIFKKGASLRNNLFILKFLKNGLEQNRFGFVVSQKVSKKAVIRNRIRRRLTEAVKAKKEKIKNGMDLVFIALPGIEKKEFSGIKEALDQTLVKTKLFLEN
jgi:ribonuclease P protein component